MKRPLYTRPRTGTGTTRQPQGNGTTRNTGSTSRGGNVSAITRQNGIDDTYSDILGHNAGDDLLNQLLANLGIEQEKGLTGSQRDDWNKQLLDAQLQHYMDLEKRQYTADTLGEQRLYDSPLNQLARLMGAGISRDAAISMLQGGQQATLAESAVSPTGLSASESKANEVNNALGVVNSVFGAISAVTSLCQCGIGLPMAIEQVRSMSAQNYFTRSQMSALQGVNEITQAFNSAVQNGILTVDDIQGLRTADDYYRYINDHSETELCAPLIKSGAFARAFGSTYGREFMNHHLQQTRDARDSAKLYDSFLNQQDMASELATITTAAARRQYYLDWSKGLQDLLQGDAELKLLYQQYRNGEKQISINGEILKQEQYRTKSAERADFFEGAQFDAGKKALERNYHINYDGYETDVNGYELLNYHEFTKLLRSYQQDQALSGRQAVHYKDSEGNINYVSARERYGRLLSENVNIALTGAFLQEVISSNRLSGYSGNLDWLYKFSDMWNASGLGGVVKTVGDIIP